MESIVPYLFGPEIVWMALYILARVIRPAVIPAPEAVNRRLEIFAWTIPTAGTLLSFAILSIIPLDWWMLLRIVVSGIIGVIVLAGNLGTAIDYADSRNSGVGTLVFFTYGLGLGIILIGGVVCVAVLFVQMLRL